MGIKGRGQGLPAALPEMGQRQSSHTRAPGAQRKGIAAKWPRGRERLATTASLISGFVTEICPRSQLCSSMAKRFKSGYLDDNVSMRHEVTVHCLHWNIVRHCEPQGPAERRQLESLSGSEQGGALSTRARLLQPLGARARRLPGPDVQVCSYSQQ